MSIRTGMNKVALSIGRIAYKNGVTRKIYNGMANDMIVSKLKLELDMRKAMKDQAGDFFRGVLLKNKPPMEFYYRTRIPVIIHSPNPCSVGEQWKYHKKGVKEVTDNIVKLASGLSIELSGREISYFKSSIWPLFPGSFTGNVLHYPGVNEDWDDRSFAFSLNCIRQSDEVKEHVLTDKLVNDISLLLLLYRPS